MISVGRIVKAAGKLAFMDDTFSKITTDALKTSAKTTNWRNIHNQNWKSIHRQIGRAFKEAESKTYKDSFWKNLWEKNICGFPKDIANAWNSTSGAWKVTKAVGGQLMKRLPVVFAALELFNIVPAFKDEGLFSGLKETVRSATRLTTSMAGFIAGQALIPIPLVGGLIGAIATDLVVGKCTDLLLGKSYSERKAEAEEAQNAKKTQEEQYKEQLEQYQKAIQNSPYGDMNQYATNYQAINPTMTPQQLMALKGMLYGGGMTDPMNQDFMEMSSGIGRLDYRA